MSEEKSKIPEGFETLTAAVESNAQAAETIGRLFAVASPAAVFSNPVTSGDYTVITASEVSVGMGLGFGLGGSDSGTAREAEEETDDGESDSGGGGGGGGFSTGRPVAAIEIGPNGIRIEPIVDITKIAIALFTALGAIFVARKHMRKAGRALSQ